MATIYRNPGRDAAIRAAAGPEGYSGPVEIDTRVPPKARPVLHAISVNGVPVPEADILAEAQNHPAENPGQALVAAARALVVRELLLQEVRRLGIEAPARAPGGSGRTETAEDAMIRELVEREVKTPSASETECRRFYDNNPARFRSDTIYEARHILLAAPPTDAPAHAIARKQAQRLIERLTRSPGEFAALAAEYSACPSREAGGNLGQLTRGSTVPEFEGALETMQEGEMLAEPVESRFGLHIILLERKIPGERLPFELVQQRIESWLEAASWSKAVAQYIAILAGRAEISGIDIAAAAGPLTQ
jgi:peptidyl-prolyl cis-trans isomerase C